MLLPLYGWPHSPGLIFTERRHDLRRHAGEISFPGGRSEPGEHLVDTALREAHEEIGLDPAAVEVLGALQPTSTVVTTYRVLPVVGLVPAGLAHALQPDRGRARDRDRPRRAPRGLRDAAPDPPRRPLPDADLRRSARPSSGAPPRGCCRSSSSVSTATIDRRRRRRRLSLEFPLPSGYRVLMEESREEETAGEDEPAQERSFPGAGSKTAPSDLDSMGNDKRRPVIGQQYGASAKKRLIVYGIFLVVVVALAIGFLTVVNGVDNKEIPLEDTAPWTAANALPGGAPRRRLPAQRPAGHDSRERDRQGVPAEESDSVSGG